jgi:hypothetical protein
MMYFHLAIVRRVESTSGDRDGCGLLYRPTSAKAVTSRCPPLCFLMRNDGLRQPRRRPLLGWLWQVSLAGLVNFRLAFGNYRNGLWPRKGLVDFTSSQISPITL